MYIALVNHAQSADESNKVTLLGFLGDAVGPTDSVQGVDVHIHNEQRTSSGLTEEEPLSAPSLPVSKELLDPA